jgi:hypothetical protein
LLLINDIEQNNNTMKAMVLKIFLFFAITATGINGFAQSPPPDNLVIKFGYDETGNRVWRDKVYIQNKSHQNNDTTNAQTSDSILANTISEHVSTVTLSDNGQTSVNEGQTSESYSNNINQNDLQITIYPNPTTGHLLVKIVPFNNNNRTEFSLFDLQGHQLIKEICTKELTVLDLSNYTKGVYILKVKIGSNEKEWEVVKE